MSKINKKLLCSHLILLFANVLGFICCLLRIYSAEYSVYSLSLLWTISNIFYLIIACIFDCKTKKYEYDDFKPNNVSKYSLKSIFLIFINIFKWKGEKYVKKSN